MLVGHPAHITCLGVPQVALSQVERMLSDFGVELPKGPLSEDEPQAGTDATMIFFAFSFYIPLCIPNIVSIHTFNSLSPVS